MTSVVIVLGAGERHAFNLGSPKGCRWRLESDRGVDFDSWDDESGGGRRFSILSRAIGKHVLRARCSESTPELPDGVLDLVVFVCRKDRRIYASVVEGFPLEIRLDEEGEGPWEVVEDGGTECGIVDDGAGTLLRIRCGTPGERRLALSSSEGLRMLKIRVLPVSIRARLTGKAGEPAEYSVSSNITTGFEWHVVEDGGLRCESRYVSDPNPELLDGVGGSHVFRMTADSPGTYVLRALCMRSDEFGGSLEVVFEVGPAGHSGRWA